MLHLNTLEFGATLVDRVEETVDSLYEQYEDGLISREEYQQRAYNIIINTPRTKTGCGMICVVNPDTLCVEAIYQ